MRRLIIKHYSIAGPLLWLAAVQYFIIQASVAAKALNYNFMRDSISDLGRTNCFNSFCSPLYATMDKSFIILGSTTVIGSILLYIRYKTNLLSAVGFLGMALAGVGVIIVGLFPLNINDTLHVIGTNLAFISSNIAVLLMVLSLKLTPFMRRLGFVIALTSISALIMLNTHNRNWQFQGICERAVADTQIIWLICFAIYSIYEAIRNSSWPRLKLLGGDSKFKTSLGTSRNTN